MVTEQRWPQQLPSTTWIDSLDLFNMREVHSVTRTTKLGMISSHTLRLPPALTLETPMLMESTKCLSKTSIARNGCQSSSKISILQDLTLPGTLMSRLWSKTWQRDSQIPHAGMHTTDFGQVKHLLFSLPTPVGFIWQQTPSHSTM